VTATQVCTRCCVDTTVAGATFDAQGVCSLCHLHDQLESEFPLGEEGRRRIQRTVDEIKAMGRGKPFDCVAGLSGGRDSSFTLHLLVKEFGLRPLVVHFNDGFGNPVAGENMQRMTDMLGVTMRTISSDWRESKDLRIAALRASTPDLELAADIGIASSLYGVATQEGLRHVIIGQSFRTEGIAPLEWNFLDGRYLKTMAAQFGSVKIREWTPTSPGFNLDIREMVYYTLRKRIKSFLPLYNWPYVRADVDALLTKEYGWTNPGAHYLDDLYQALMTYVLRTKFNIDRRKYNYAALVRSGQMTREQALDKIAQPYEAEDPKLIALCIKRLGLTREQFDDFMKLPPKTFRDYKTNFALIRRLRLGIWLLAQLNLVPRSSYLKYCQ
jgi:N-acetyl sugar amidotransferase